MKMQSKLVPLVAAVLALAAASGVQAADIVGATTANASGSPTINVGESQVWVPTVHTSGLAGVGVSDYLAGRRVDFQGIADFSSTTSTALGDGQTKYDYAGANHGGLGSFSFVKVGSGDVWFGEWSDAGATNDPTRQAFYVGDREGVTLPTSQATYAGKGLNRGTVLTGTLTATFGGTNRLAGTLSGSGKSIELDAAIASSTASFAGSATANGSVSGTTNGRFFGAGASALAGVANFGTASVHNTAFGGTKN